MLDRGIDFLKHVRGVSASLFCSADYAMALEPCSSAWLQNQPGQQHGQEAELIWSCLTLVKLCSFINVRAEMRLTKGISDKAGHLRLCIISQEERRKDYFLVYFFNSSVPIPENYDVHHGEKQRTGWDLRGAGQVRECSLQRCRLLLRHRALSLLSLALVIGPGRLSIKVLSPGLSPAAAMLPNSLEIHQALDAEASGQLVIMHPDFHKSAQLYEIRGLLRGEIKIFSTYLLILHLLFWNQVPVPVHIKF